REELERQEQERMRKEKQEREWREELERKELETKTIGDAKRKVRTREARRIRMARTIEEAKRIK
ncbi:hypothetical protein RhiirA5_367278, partial [Rhizophagus irregularis]